MGLVILYIREGLIKGYTIEGKSRMITKIAYNESFQGRREEVGGKRERKRRVSSLYYKIVKRVKRTKDEVKYCMYASGNIW